jgi:hypothetical protein
VGVLQGHLDKVNCCVFHPTNMELYSGANDAQVTYVMRYLAFTRDVRAV